MTEDWQNGGFGIYVHWPFCQSKCPYCDFNSHVSDNVDQEAWLSAYLKELDRYSRLLPNRVVNSVFFGGGTPSLMQEHVVSGVIDAIAKNWTTANDLEITLEANPGSVEASRFQGYRTAGVNRVSLGVQALNNHDLKRLGRLHTVEEAHSALDIAQNCFDRVSFDLIYARQDQTITNWEAELSQALTMAADHLSLYQLTIEDGTAFGDRFERGLLKGLPEDDISADMFQITQDICASVGMAAYEISNHALVGSESRHNLIYWNYGDYIGIGPGAHGRVTVDGQKYATECHKNPNEWLDAVSSGDGESIFSSVSAADQATEYLLMGMRLTSGIDRQRFQRLAGHNIPDADLNQLSELGVIEFTENTIRATERGRPILNAILTEIATLD